MAKKKKNAPMLIKAMNLGDMLDDAIKNAPAPKELTEEDIKKRDKLVQEWLDSQGPGDAAMIISFGPKKV